MHNAFFRTHQRQNFRIGIQGYLIIIQIKSAILFAILAIPNSGIDVHFHLPTPASQHQ
jgi:hypothetical protein